MGKRVRRGRKRGRAVLLWGAATFVLVQLAVGLLLDCRGLGIRFPEADQHVRRLAAHPRSPDVLILGSSRFHGALAEGHVSRLLQEATGQPDVWAANVAVRAGDLVTADFLLRHLLRNGCRPRLAIVEVSPETLHRRNFWLNWHTQRQFGWSDSARHIGEIVETGNLGKWLRARGLPLFLHRRQIWRWSSSAVAEVLAGLLETGPLPLTASASSLALDAAQRAPDRRPKEADAPLGPFSEDRDEELLSSKERKQRAELARMGLQLLNEWLEGYAVGGSAAEALDNILASCQQHRIAVVMVGVPVSSAHRACYTPAVEAAYAAHLRQAALRPGVRYVDYRARLPDACFRDNHHLADAGAKQFCRQLVEEVLADALR